MNTIIEAPKLFSKLLIASVVSLLLASQATFAADYGQDEEAGQERQTQQTQPAGQEQQIGQQPEGQQPQREQRTGESGDVKALVTLNGQDVPVEKIEGLEVVNAQGEEIGSVQDVVTNGDEAAVVVGVGGFFGLGAKDILVDLNDVTMQEERLVWQTEADEEALEALPEYNKEEYVSIR